MYFLPASLLVHLALTSFAGFLSAVAAVRLLRIQCAATKSSLFAGALLFPAGSFVTHLLFPQHCEMYASSGSLLHAACKIGSKMGNAGLLLVSSSFGIAISQALASLLAARRALREASPVSDQTLPVMVGLREICKRAGIRTPRVLVTRRRGVLCTIGVFRPSILISRELLETLEPDEMMAALAHEIAHIVRNDNVIGIAAGIIRWLTFFSPASHFAMTFYLNEREKAADDFAVELAGNHLALASSMIKVLKDMRKISPVEPAGISFALREKAFDRIERLLVPKNVVSESRLRYRLISFVAMVGMLLTVLAIC
ncbi:MAG TPA: M56 family metallopeptidase [Firmicutes bacterium]|nr:M56 family metallopeptidase [Candidatus Fermentithermobacillaceae bacterium]